MSERNARGSFESETPRDVLAAEAFAVPGPDPVLRQGPVTLPEDPSGIAEPHDVLAAEEFAMPAVRSSRPVASGLVAPSRRSAKVRGGVSKLLALIGLRQRARD